MPGGNVRLAGKCRNSGRCPLQEALRQVGLRVCQSGAVSHPNMPLLSVLRRNRAFGRIPWVSRVKIAVEGAPLVLHVVDR